MVIDDTGSVEGIYAFIYCTKWRSGQVLPMPDSLTDSQTLKDSATQLLIKYKQIVFVTKKCVNSCKTIQKLLRPPGYFPDYPESFHIIKKNSRLSVNFSNN